MIRNNFSKMLELTVFIIVFILTLSNYCLAEGRYEAIISCGMNGQHMNAMVCFSDTELKVTTEDRSRLYKVWEISQAGSERSDGIHIFLPEKFQIIMQNSDSTLTLGLKILDDNGKIVFEDQAGKYDVINVEN